MKVLPSRTHNWNDEPRKSLKPTQIDQGCHITGAETHCGGLPRIRTLLTTVRFGQRKASAAMASQTERMTTHSMSMNVASPGISGIEQ